MASSASVGLRRSPFMEGIIYEALRRCQYESVRRCPHSEETAETAEIAEKNFLLCVLCELRGSFLFVSAKDRCERQAAGDVGGGAEHVRDRVHRQQDADAV